MHSQTASKLEGPGGRKIFPLSRLALSIGSQLQHTFQSAYWITAEISKLNLYPQSGHCYPELVEKREGAIVAQMRAFMANQRYKEMQANFAKTTGKPLTDGLQVLILCKVSFHPVYGLSLNIIDLEPAYTLGEMARLRQEALERLRKEGLLERNKQLHLPLLLKRLAVISVETSKGWLDFRATLDAHPYGVVVDAELYTALLQGDAAVQSMLAALERIALSGKQYDAVCIIRGGGGETGFDCYDQYPLAAAVSAYPLPVLTGIGHSSNVTVVEVCAHKNLITPTALAEFILDGFERYEDRLLQASQALLNVKKNLIRHEVLRLESRTITMERASSLFVQRKQQALRDQARQFEGTVKDKLNLHKALVHYKLPAQLAENTRQHLRSKSHQVVLAQPRLNQHTRLVLNNSESRLKLASETLRLLDPQLILKRGFSITTHKGLALKDASTLTEGAEITTYYHKGQSISIITKTPK